MNRDDLLKLASSVAGRVRPCPIDRDDIEQEAYLLALQFPSVFVGPVYDLSKEAGLFIKTRLENLRKRDARARKKAGYVSMGCQDDDADSLDPVDRTPPPDELAEQSELLDRVKACLTPRQADVIERAIWDGATNAEVAHLTGSNVRSVENCKSRALKRIADRLLI